MPSTILNQPEAEQVTPPPTEREYRLLRLAVTAADEGFRLVIATCNDTRLQESLIQRLKNDLLASQRQVSVLDLSQTATCQGLLTSLAEHLKNTPLPDGWQQAIMVVGSETRVAFSSTNPSDRAFFETANAQRDAFAREIPVPVVMWLTPLTTAALGQYAPDLWHWRVAALDFKVPWESRLELFDNQLMLPAIEVDSLPSEEKQKRIATFRRLLAELESTSEEEKSRPSVMSRKAGLLLALGNTLLDTGNFQEAASYYEQAHKIYGDIRDVQGEGIALSDLGRAYDALGQSRKSIEYHKKSLAIARKIGNRQSESCALGNLGNAYRNLGKVKKAINFFENALEIARENRDRRTEGNCLGNLGNAYTDLGNEPKAKEFYENRLNIAREIGDQGGQGKALGNLGNIYTKMGNARLAIENHEKALEFCREIGDRVGEAANLGNIGSAYASLGESENAIRFYRKALAGAREIEDLRSESIHSWNLARALWQKGDEPEAIRYAESAIQILEAIGSPRAEIIRRNAAIMKASTKAKQ